MAQLHKLAAVSLTIALSSMSNVFALGLGEVTWKSNLNQPLDAEIAVYDARNVSNKELVVKIASAEDFAKAGITRPFVLNDLVFTPMINSNGKGVIKITSKHPIQEPYLDFLLHVKWATGQTLREYTLLIDPPAYESSSVLAPVSAKPVKKNTRPLVKAPQKAPQSKPARAQAPSTAKAQPGTVKAFRGASLWLLAERNRSRGVSVQQAMLAIYEANPDAFIDGKMSLLKEGAVLRIPKADEMRKTTTVAAEQQVLANVNGTVQAKPRQVIAGKTGEQPTSGKEVKDELKLSGVTDTKAAKASPSSIEGLENALNQTAEELDATRRNNEDLKDRVKSLESSLADMKKMIELKNNQLAALQQNIKSQTLDSQKDTKSDAIADNQQNPSATPEKNDNTATDQQQQASQGDQTQPPQEAPQTPVTAEQEPY